MDMNHIDQMDMSCCTIPL